MATKAARVSVPSGPTKIGKELENLSDRFEGFKDELQLQKQKKKSDDEKKIIALQEKLESLQNALAIESKNRATSVQALQNWFTDRLSQLKVDIEKPIYARLDHLQQQIDVVRDRVEAVEKAHQEDRERFPQMIDARVSEILTEIKDIRDIIDVGQKRREEKEKRILLKMGENFNSLTAKIDEEKTSTDQRFVVLRQDLVDETSIRVRGVDLLKERLEQAVAELRTQIEQETTTRAAADEQITVAVTHFSALLQDGVKIVSTQ